MRTNYNSHSNISQSFAQSIPLIDRPDNTNKGMLLHNNIHEKIMVERVVDYRIQISSIDRDINRFPNMFDIKVSLGNTNFKPHIEKSFSNIKYITLNHVILPRTLAIDTTNINLTSNPPVYDIYPSGSLTKPPYATKPSTILHDLEQHSFLTLKIKELNTDNCLGTNPLLDRDTFMIFQEKKFGDTWIWKPKRATIVYPNSLLGNLNQLSLCIVDELGRKINMYDTRGSDIMTNKILETGNGPDSCNYNTFATKYQSLSDMTAYTYSTSQLIYDFTFGVIENEMNTVTNFQ
jgi:hypothetical protein